MKPYRTPKTLVEMNAPLSTQTLLPYCNGSEKMSVNKVIRYVFRWVCLFSTKVKKEKNKVLL